VTTASTVALVLLATSGLLTTARLALGPTFADRVVALDTLLLVVVSGVAVDAARTGRTEFLGVLVLASIIAFVATAFAARFIEARGRDAATAPAPRTGQAPDAARGDHDG
jgi:multicomponent Na+:H+ antiporter subunit F